MSGILTHHLMQANNEFNIYKDGEGDEIRMGYRKSGLQADGERAVIVHIMVNVS